MSVFLKNSLAHKLLEQNFLLKNDECFVGEIPVISLARQYGTPLFIYDFDVVDRQYQDLRKTFPKKVSIFYSVKANSNQRFLKFFLSNDCGLEIASAGEFAQVLRSGCPPKNILFAGPGKTDFELEYVLVNGIGEIHAESINEIRRIALIASKLGEKAKVALRVNPNEEAQGGAMRMGGKPSQFGIDEEQIDEVLAFIQSQESIQFQGIHLFSGTQILDEDILMKQYKKAVAIGKRVFLKTGKALHTVDFGGGLGIPYFAGEGELNLPKLRERLSKLFLEINNDPAFSHTRFVVEPGRFLVGPAGIYIVQVLDIKRSRGKNYVIVNGGMNHHLAASGNLGQVIRKNFPIVNFSQISAGDPADLDVVGPLCTPLDTLGRRVRLPMPKIGDFIGILQSGAYARTASPLGFLSHVTPPEVMVCKDKSELIRRTGTFDDLVHDQR